MLGWLSRRLCVINFSTEKKKSLHLKQHPIQRVNPKNEKCPNTGGNCGGYISIIGFFKIVFAIDKTTKTFNWVKTSVASRYNTTRPLIGRAHTRNKTELTIIFSLPFRPAYWPLPSSSNERKREREKQTLVFVTRTIFTYGFISLVSPDHAIQFRRVSWLGPWSKGPPTTKSKFPLEQWKYTSIKENARTDGIITWRGEVLLARFFPRYFAFQGEIFLLVHRWRNLSFDRVGIRWIFFLIVDFLNISINSTGIDFNRRLNLLSILFSTNSPLRGFVVFGNKFCKSI